MNSAPIESNLRALMNDIGRILGGVLHEQTEKTGEDYRFALLMFAADKTGEAGEVGSINYISNAERRSMIEALKEFIRNAEAEAAAEDATRA